MAVKNLNKKMFLKDHADAMAIELHKITGYPLGMWRGSAPMFGRAFSIIDIHPCVIKDDQWIDVTGLNTGSPKHDDQITKTELVPVTEEEVWTIIDERKKKELLEAANRYIHEDMTLTTLLNLG